jgi:replicative DNA helicase
METKIILEPSSPDPEIGVLGCIFDEPESIHEVMDKLDVEDFYGPTHRSVYRGMIYLSRNNQEPTVGNVETWLNSTKTEYCRERFEEISLSGSHHNQLEEACGLIKEKSITRKPLSKLQDPSNEPLDNKIENHVLEPNKG